MTLNWKDLCSSWWAVPPHWSRNSQPSAEDADQNEKDAGKHRNLSLSITIAHLSNQMC